MKQQMMWKRHVCKVSGSYGIALPKGYLKSNGIQPDDMLIFELKRNGLLLIFRKPVNPSQEEVVTQ